MSIFLVSYGCENREIRLQTNAQFADDGLSKAVETAKNLGVLGQVSANQTGDGIKATIRPGCSWKTAEKLTIRALASGISDTELVSNITIAGARFTPNELAI